MFLIDIIKVSIPWRNKLEEAEYKDQHCFKLKNKLVFNPVVCCMFTWYADSTGYSFLCYGNLQ